MNGSIQRANGRAAFVCAALMVPLIGFVLALPARTVANQPVQPLCAEGRIVPIYNPLPVVPGTSAFGAGLALGEGVPGYFDDLSLEFAGDPQFEFLNEGITHFGRVYVYFYYDPAPARYLLRTFDQPFNVGSVGDPDHEFGEGLAYDNGTLAVGAWRALGGRGRVLFYDVPSGMLLGTIEGVQSVDTLGRHGAIALRGPDLLLGAIGNTTAGLTAGAVYVYDAATRAPLYTLTNPNPPGANGHFGVSVALDESRRALIGARGNNLTGTPGEGAAYLYDVPTGSLLATIENPDAPNTTGFGSSVDIQGGYALIGGFGAGTEKAFVFEVPSGNLLHVLENPSPDQDADFGFRVALAADLNLAAVGAPIDNAVIPGVTFHQGAVWTFSLTTGNPVSLLLNPGSDGFQQPNTGSALAARDGRVYAGVAGATFFPQAVMVYDAAAAALACPTVPPLSAPTCTPTATVSVTPTPSPSPTATASPTPGPICGGGGAMSVTNPGLIIVGPAAGLATPYPSAVTVSGVPAAPLSKVTVELYGLNASSASHLDLALVGPDGTAVVLMSDCGDVVSGANLVFDQSALQSLPAAPAPLVSGVYRPTNLGGNTDNFPGPGPGTDHSTTLDAFVAKTGSQVNGNWSLFMVKDQTGASAITLAGGWRLNLFYGCESSPTPTVSPTASASPTPSVSPTPTPAPCCIGDASNNGAGFDDGQVDGRDFVAVSQSFGDMVSPGGVGDADCSGGTVDLLDHIAVRNNFGNRCGPATPPSTGGPTSGDVTFRVEPQYQFVDTAVDPDFTVRIYADIVNMDDDTDMDFLGKINGVGQLSALINFDDSIMSFTGGTNNATNTAGLSPGVPWHRENVFTVEPALAEPGVIIQSCATLWDPLVSPDLMPGVQGVPNGSYLVCTLNFTAFGSTGAVSTDNLRFLIDASAGTMASRAVGSDEIELLTAVGVDGGIVEILSHPTPTPTASPAATATSTPTPTPCPPLAECVFPVTLAANTTGAADSTFTGPPDDAFFGIGNASVTFALPPCAEIIDLPGPDFNVYEADFGSNEFAAAQIMVSTDGLMFTDVSSAAQPLQRIPGDETHGDDAFARSYDLQPSGLGGIRFVRIQGLSGSPPGATAGFDLDAIGIIHNSADDCNMNGVRDECDIAFGSSMDVNMNGVPDECETVPTPTPTAAPCCPGDADNSGSFVDANDFISVQANFGADNGVGGLGDANCSGSFVDANDFIAVQANFGADCG